MNKATLQELLWYIATNGTHRVHDLFDTISGVKAEDTEVQSVLSGLTLIAEGKKGQTDLALWNKVMDLRNNSFAGNYVP